MKKRKICVVTGSRADYGHLYWIMKEIQNDSSLKLQVIAGAAHLLKQFGRTVEKIEKDGFSIAYKARMPLATDSPEAVSKSLGIGVDSFAKGLKKLNPDLLVILGDRYEIFAAAQAAMIARIPIAHIHGGESTEGLIDEAIRHSITKMAHLHFAASETYRKHIIQMGEEPNRVFNYGAPGLDHIKKTKALTLQELESCLKIKIHLPLFLVTYHPVTLEGKKSLRSAQELFKALNHFRRGTIIITKSNTDPLGLSINQLIDEYVEKKSRTFAFTSLGQEIYLSLMHHATLLVGNSSSGIIEAPFMGKISINIGDRQKGRLRAKTVIDCPENSGKIKQSIQSGLIRSKKVKPDFLYGKGRASMMIKKEIKYFPLGADLLKKKFYVPAGCR